jgi:phosphatidylglycerol:prolipoprotein diacylglycerol transferase
VHPTLFRFGNFLVPTQISLLVIGLLLSVFVLLRHASRYGTHWKIIMDSVIAACIGGLVFGRLGAILVNFAWFKEHPSQIWSIGFGGLHVYGGMVGVAVALSLVAVWYRHNFLRLTDLFAMVAPIFLVAVSIGNLMQGAAFGALSSSALGVVASQPEASMPLGFARHPVQLYMAAAIFVFYALILSYERSKILHGHISALFLIGFPFIREVISIFRDDVFVKPLVGSNLNAFIFSIDSVIALFFMASGIGLLFFLRSRRFSP